MDMSAATVVRDVGVGSRDDAENAANGVAVARPAVVGSPLVAEFPEVADLIANRFSAGERDSHRIHDELPSRVGYP